MGVDEQARKVLARFNQRTAGEFPFQQPKGEAPAGAPQKREIPKDHPYDPKALKPLSKALFATSVALGHVLAAHKHFSQVKSPAVSPDGRIGGRGYIMSMNEIRRKLWEASESLSSVSDALHDEINAPHWKPKLALLDENDQEDISRFVEESQEVLENPGEEAEEEIEKIDKENDGEEAKGSQMPQGGNAPDEAQKLEDQPGEPRQTKQASASQHATFRDLVKSVFAGLDCQVGGPRVDDRDPGAGEGPFNSFNPIDDATGDEWGESGGAHSDDYDYPSGWENDLHEASDLLAEAQQWAESFMPSDPKTPTDGRDFGLGYGARGKAEENLGDWSPHSGLPGIPWQPSGDNTPTVDVNLNEKHGLNSLLPGDGSIPVARTDYYKGDRGNLVNVGATPETPDTDERDLSFIDTGYVYDDLDTDRLPNGDATLDDER